MFWGYVGNMHFSGFWSHTTVFPDTTTICSYDAPIMKKLAKEKVAWLLVFIYIAAHAGLCIYINACGKHDESMQTLGCKVCFIGAYL